MVYLAGIFLRLRNLNLQKAVSIAPGFAFCGRKEPRKYRILQVLINYLGFTNMRLIHSLLVKVHYYEQYACSSIEAALLEHSLLPYM